MTERDTADDRVERARDSMSGLDEGSPEHSEGLIELEDATGHVSRLAGPYVPPGSPLAVLRSTRRNLARIIRRRG